MPRRRKLQAAEAVPAAAPPGLDATAVVAAPKRKQRGKAAKGPETAVEITVKAEEIDQKPEEVPVAKKKRNYANAYTRRGQGFSALVDSLAFEELPVKAESGEEGTNKVTVRAVAVPEAQNGTKTTRAKKGVKKQAETFVDALEGISEKTKVEEVKEEATEAPKKRQRKKAPKVEAEEERIMEEASEDAQQLPVDEATLVAAPKRQRKRRQADPNAPPPFEIPTVEILEEAAKHVPGPRPVPNLGFACLNATLRSQKPPIFSNRDCIKRTFEAKGLDWISALCVENTRSLVGLIEWNQRNGIRFFRMSSKIFPWCTEWSFEQLPQKQEVADNLEFAGKLARAYQQRLTFHPSHFVKLGCEDGPLLARSIKELEVHSQILDLMGYSPSPENKINIHIGGMYGDKDATILRFAENFKKLSPNCKARLTVENDDWANSYSIADLQKLHELIGVPLVFDFHHHRFCPGGLSEEEALKAALATWPKGIRPVVHWSESQEGRRPSAHSDFVKGPLRLYGLDDQIDIMIEAKGKELALLRLRDPDFKPTAAALATIADDG